LQEPQRCVHIGDRESDIYEFFSTAHELGTPFLVRTRVERRAGVNSEIKCEYSLVDGNY
jgi:hypothetical protein